MKSRKPHPFKDGYETSKPKTARQLHMFAIEEAVFQYVLIVELFCLLQCIPHKEHSSNQNVTHILLCDSHAVPYVGRVLSI
jgi:hypothetical protein